MILHNKYMNVIEKTKPVRTSQAAKHLNVTKTTFLKMAKIAGYNTNGNGFWQMADVHLIPIIYSRVNQVCELFGITDTDIVNKMK